MQLRLKKDSLDAESSLSLIRQSSELCLQHDAKLLLNIPENILNDIDLSQISFAGFHADSRKLKTEEIRPDGKLFSASCHSRDELEKAIRLKADFVVLSPVQKTASHPDMEPMGWQHFSELVVSCSIPVFALGGVSEKDMQDAWQYGAQGVAAISAFWL